MTCAHLLLSCESSFICLSVSTMHFFWQPATAIHILTAHLLDKKNIGILYKRLSGTSLNWPVRGLVINSLPLLVVVFSFCDMGEPTERSPISAIRGTIEMPASDSDCKSTWMFRRGIIGRSLISNRFLRFCFVWIQFPSSHVSAGEATIPRSLISHDLYVIRGDPQLCKHTGQCSA